MKREDLKPLIKKYLGDSFEKRTNDEKAYLVDTARSLIMVNGITKKLDGFRGYNKSLFKSSILTQTKTKAKRSTSDMSARQSIRMAKDMIVKFQADNDIVIFTPRHSIWGIIDKALGVTIEQPKKSPKTAKKTAAKKSSSTKNEAIKARIKKAAKKSSVKGIVRKLENIHLYWSEGASSSEKDFSSWSDFDTFLSSLPVPPPSSSYTKVKFRVNWAGGYISDNVRIDLSESTGDFNPKTMSIGFYLHGLADSGYYTPKNSKGELVTNLSSLDWDNYKSKSDAKKTKTKTAPKPKKSATRAGKKVGKDSNKSNKKAIQPVKKEKDTGVINKPLYVCQCCEGGKVTKGTNLIEVLRAQGIEKNYKSIKDKLAYRLKKTATAKNPIESYQNFTAPYVVEIDKKTYMFYRF